VSGFKVIASRNKRINKIPASQLLKDGTEPTEDWAYTIFYGKANENFIEGLYFFVHKTIIKAVTRVEFVSDRMLYAI
jgi:hypothetical protein